MAGITLSSEASYAELAWTGVETSFAPGFKADADADVYINARNTSDVSTALTRGLHYTVSRAADGLVTITPLALPAAPQTLEIYRRTPALQPTDFANLGGYTADVHTRLHTLAAMRDAELRREIEHLDLLDLDALFAAANATRQQAAAYAAMATAARGAAAISATEAAASAASITDDQIVLKAQVFG